MTTAVALVTVVISGLVSNRLVHSAAETQELKTLSRLASVAAAAAEAAPGTAGSALDRVLANTRVESGLGIHFLRVDALGLTPTRLNPRHVTALPAALLAQAAAGQTFETTTQFRGALFLVAGYPVASASGGDYLVLEPASAVSQVSQPVGRRLLVALAIGLAVAAAAGVLLARRLARPLQHAAGAAHRLAAGDRDIRLVAEGPAEVAEVSDALNSLAGALATSEARQREFLLSVSHELRTPLTSIKGYAEALADGVVPAPELAATGATVLAESARLERLVSDLLDLARLGADDFRIDLAQVDLGEVLHQAEAVWVRRCAKEQVELRTEFPAGPLLATTDATRVRQILDGLAENALRVAPRGAPIVLALRPERQQAVLEVRDGGPGLTDDDLAVAFERSALYDRYRGVRRVGTGVGLALVAGLAARLGGTVEAGHAAEGGARFTVRLPLATVDGTPARR